MTIDANRSGKEISRRLPVVGALAGTVLVTAFFAGLFSYDPAVPAPEPRTSGEVVLLLPEDQKAAKDLQRWFSVHDPSIIARAGGSASGELPLPERRAAGEPAAPEHRKSPEIMPLPELTKISVTQMDLPSQQTLERGVILKQVPQREIYPRILVDDVSVNWARPAVNLPKGCKRFSADFFRGSSGDLRYGIVHSCGDRKVDLELIRHLWKDVQRLNLPVRVDMEWERIHDRN